jgi:hypothetical protein
MDEKGAGSENAREAWWKGTKGKQPLLIDERGRKANNHFWLMKGDERQTTTFDWWAESESDDDTQSQKGEDVAKKTASVWSWPRTMM